MVNVKIKRTSATAKLPTKAHVTDAAFDLYADCLCEGEDKILIAPGETVLVSSGISTDIPEGYWGAIFARSGLATKEGLRPANCVPVIDRSYRGCWKVPLHNDSDVPRTVNHGDRIAQFMLLPTFETNLIEVDNLEDSDRGETGFGDSGKQ